MLYIGWRRAENIFNWIIMDFEMAIAMMIYS
jgi:hypothetical protein